MADPISSKGSPETGSTNKIERSESTNSFFGKLKLGSVDKKFAPPLGDIRDRTTRSTPSFSVDPSSSSSDLEPID